MACRSLVEKLLGELENLKHDQNIEKNDAFLLVKNSARVLLKDQKFQEYQFQIVIHDIATKIDQLVIISRIYEV